MRVAAEMPSFALTYSGGPAAPAVLFCMQPKAQPHTPAGKPVTPRRATFLEYLRSKDFFKLLAILVGTALLLPLFVLYVFLPLVTRQGSTVAVPDVMSRPEALASEMLHNNDLDVVVIDSQFVAGVQPRAVITQDPASGELVKPGRKVYLVLNKQTPPDTKLPDIIDVNLAQAKYMLQNWGLKVGKITYVAGDARDLILRAQIGSRSVKPGDPVKVGARVDLTVALGTAARDTEVPDLVGLSLDEATALLNDAGLAIGKVTYSRNPKYPEDGTVHQQRPAYPSPRVKPGTSVDLSVTGRRREASEAPAKKNPEN